MKKHINTSIEIIICILMVVNLTGCNGSRELNKVSIVMGIGLDKGEDPDTVKTTVQIAKVSDIKSSTQSGGNNLQGTAYLNLTETRESISEAVKALNRKLNRQLIFSHNQVIIFGDDAAKSGIKRYIDFFLRYRETRLLVWMLVSKGPADKILDLKPPIEQTAAMSIGELIRNQEDVSQIPTVDLKDFASKLMSKTTAPVAPIIEVSKDDKNKIAYLSETAVFKKDKMVGTLNIMETRGLLWGTNGIRNGVVVISKPNNEENVNVKTTRAKSKIIPQIKDGKPSIKIEIKQEGDLQEQTSSVDYANPKAFTMLQNNEEDIIKKEVISAVEKAKYLNADIFGFGDSIYQHYPKEWGKIQNSWNEIFKNINVDVQVEAKIRRTGRITKPIMSKEQ